MPFCIDRAFTALLFCLIVATATGQQGPMLDAGPVRPKVDPADLDPKVRAAADTLDKLRDGVAATPEQWAVICEACGLNPSIAGFAREVKPFPASVLVGLLSHRQFAVRLGALEILEGLSNDDFKFDPWNATSESSAKAIKDWQAWAATTEGRKPSANTTQTKPAPLDADKMRGYLVDLVAFDTARHERAYDALAQGGMSSVAFLEQYLHDTPQLTDGVRARIKEAQYRLVLQESLPKQAAKLARDLVYGSRDVKLEAMQQLPRCHEKAVPILAEYIPDSDALIREASMDALILAGGEKVYDLVEQRLKVETDENVIHAVLRRVSCRQQRGAALIARFVQDANEDLAVASLNALADGQSHAADSQMSKCLADKRWRVRVAALECAGKLRITSLESEVIKAFGDSDEFVRYAAMKSAADMGLKSAVGEIAKLALKDDSMLGPATEAIVRMGQLLPKEMVNVLPGKPGESLLSVLRAFGQRAGHDGSQIDFSSLREHSSSGHEATALQAIQIIRSLVKHRDPDVQVMALHLLTQNLYDLDDKKLVFEALKNASPKGRIGIMEGLRPGPFDFRESLVDDEPLGPNIPPGEPKNVFDQVLREPPPHNPAQEEVYAAFGIKLPSTLRTVVADSAQPNSRQWNPMDREFSELFTGYLKQKTDPELAFLAAQQLALGGQRAAVKELHAMLPRLEPHQRARIAEYLAYADKLTKTQAAEPLMRSLLQDESPEVRSDAVEVVLRGRQTGPVRLLLAEFLRPKGSLRAADVYNYNLVEATEKASSRTAVSTWCEEVLNDQQAPEQAHTLALALLGTTGSPQALALTKARLTSPNVWLRRAAWHNMARLSRAEFETQAAVAAKDSSALVREVVASSYCNLDNLEWRIWFGEQEWQNEYTPYRQRQKTYSLPQTIEPLLQTLSNDSDAHVRLMAMITLITHSKTVDPLKLREALAAAPDEKERQQLVRNVIDKHARTLGPRYGFLLEYVNTERDGDDSRWDSLVKALRPVVAGKNAPALTSFASLVREEVKEAPEATTKTATDAKGTAPANAARELQILFFSKPGCKDCERTRDMLANLAESLPIKLQEFNIETSDGAQYNQVLCQRFKVDPTLYQVSPAIFTQAGALVKTEINYNAVQRLVEKASEAEPDPSWAAVTEQARQQANNDIVQRYESFSIFWVLAAGLLDGINPCAFATIIFFLSYLRIARRSPREILLVGGVFILAVFLAYLLVGLGLSHVISKLQAFAWVRIWLNRVLAFIALLLAWLSFRDGIRAWRGQLGEMTLQLPEFLKNRIRSVVREQSRSRHFVVAAFVSGVIISFLELACTGQVYLPTIVYMMKQGSISAFAYLLVYNLAFIAPLIVIFVLAFMGMTSNALIAFQTRHTATVRFATAGLFLALWIVLLVA